MHNSKTYNSTTKLDNGHSVPTDLYDYVVFVVEEKIPTLSSSKSYTLRSIFGEDKWNDLYKKNKIDAGKIMVHLVKKGELQMILANKCEHQSPKKYRFI